MKNLKCEIIAVGNELLFGDVVNTNAAYLSSKLAELGIIITRHTVVPDDESIILEATAFASKNNDIVIFSGGLGPTDDDLTKETLAKFLGVDLILDDFSLGEIHKYFKKKNIYMPKKNEKQALQPLGSKALKNANGTAPGTYARKSAVHYFLLPGPPSELKPMFTDEVVPILKSLSDMAIASKTMSVMGIGESDMAEMLGDLLDNESNPKVAPYASPGVVKFKITAYGKDEKEVNDLVNAKRDELFPIMKDYLLSEDGDDLEEVLIKELKEKSQTLAIAESCTGGLVSASIVAVPSASMVLKKSNITYSNESKIKDIGVKPSTIEDFGAVSEICAKEMAEGVRRSAGSDFGLAITGIAGPDGGSEEKPVGTVFIAVCNEDESSVKKYVFTGNRARVRNSASRYAMIDLLKFMRK